MSRLRCLCLKTMGHLPECEGPAEPFDIEQDAIWWNTRWQAEVQERDALRAELATTRQQLERARVVVRDLADELAGWVNDGCIICGCRQSEAHGQNDYIKKDECESHGAVNRGRAFLTETSPRVSSPC